MIKTNKNTTLDNLHSIASLRFFINIYYVTADQSTKHASLRYVFGPF